MVGQTVDQDETFILTIDLAVVVIALIIFAVRCIVLYTCSMCKELSLHVACAQFSIFVLENFLKKLSIMYNKRI